MIFKFDDYQKAWKAVLIMRGAYYRHYRIIESLDFLGLHLNCCILILLHAFLTTIILVENTSGFKDHFYSLQQGIPMDMNMEMHVS